MCQTVPFFSSYINERNRQRNVTRAELALKVSQPQVVPFDFVYILCLFVCLFCLCVCVFVGGASCWGREGRRPVHQEKMPADTRHTGKVLPAIRSCTLIMAPPPPFPTQAVRDSGAAELVQQLSQSKAAASRGGKDGRITSADTSLLATPNGQSSSGLPGGGGGGGSGSATPNTTSTPAAAAHPPKSDQLDDLFSAHDFDIQIDLPSGTDHGECQEASDGGGGAI